MNAMEQPAPRSTTTTGTGPDEIQQDIERTRAQLGQTADALAHKLDPKAQAKEKLEQARDRGAATATHARAVTEAQAKRAQRLYRERPSAVLGAAAGVAMLVVAAVFWRRNS